jgi:hypothetical protein
MFCFSAQLSRTFSNVSFQFGTVLKRTFFGLNQQLMIPAQIKNGANCVNQPFASVSGANVMITFFGTFQPFLAGK